MTDPSADRAPHVLYVDDDVGLCVLVRRGLERRGFAVAVENDATQAATRATERAYDAVAIDHYMPRQDGLATLQQLRDAGLDVPIVYVTGSDESRIAVAALKAGAVDYVVKSGAEDFLDLLARALRQAIEQVRLRREMEAAEQALYETNQRLEAVVERQAVLLREVNHRVANSLQLVQSLVGLQAGAVQDERARAALKDTQNRVSAIMQIHRRLYTSDDVSNVDAAGYLRGLVEELERSLAAAGGERRIVFQADPVLLDTDRAVSLGVVVTELVTNACKYAYGSDGEGDVRVDLHLNGDGRVHLIVEDDGCGLPPPGAKPRGTGLGRRVVEAMAQSLSSELRIDPDHGGTRATLTFAL